MVGTAEGIPVCPIGPAALLGWARPSPSRPCSGPGGSPTTGFEPSVVPLLVAVRRCQSAILVTRPCTLFSFCCMTSLCFILYLSPTFCSSSEESRLLPSQIENLEYFCRTAWPAPTSNTSFPAGPRKPVSVSASDLCSHLSLGGQGPSQPLGPGAEYARLWVTLSFPVRSFLAHWGLPVAQIIFCLMDSGLFQKDLILLNFAQP